MAVIVAGDLRHHPAGRRQRPRPAGDAQHIGISPLLVLLSLLVGAAVGGLVGAFLAVPIAASVEIVLNRLQARETPVALDAAAIETPDEETRDALERSPARRPGFVRFLSRFAPPSGDLSSSPSEER